MSDYRYNQYHYGHSTTSQKVEVNISKEQLFSHRKRLLFSFADRQKGATNHDKAKRETQGLKGSRERSVIPQRLCEHIVDICEEG